MNADYQLAPGNVLQLMYVKRRLASLAGKRFFEVGAGNGHLSACLLSLGLSGVGFDLNTSACENNAKAHHLSIAHLAGLTYPLSNWLAPLSNYLTERGERHKLGLTTQERTVQSGNRDVRWKTAFPRFVAYLVNDFTLYPFYLLQRAFRNHPGSMVIYCEFARAKGRQTES